MCIGGIYYNTSSAIRHLKEMGRPARGDRWMLHALAWDLFQMTQSEHAHLLPAGMAHNLQNMCLNMSRPANALYLLWQQQVDLLHDTHENFITYVAQDAVVLPDVLRGMVTTVNYLDELCTDQAVRQKNWTGLTFFQWAFRYACQEMQMPLYILGEVQPDP